MESDKFTIKNFDKDFLLINAKGSSDLRFLGKAIFSRQFDFVEEVIVTESEICLKLNEHYVSDSDEMIKKILVPKKNDKKHYKLPVYFENHEDWDRVTKYTKLKKEEIITQITNTKVDLSMFGFLPGFLYMEGLQSHLHVPRKKNPAKYVKANSIAIGGKYLGLYAIDSPGGWNVIGKTPLSLLDMDKLPPVKVDLGDELNIEQISKTAFNTLAQEKLTLEIYNQ